jgi:hypothetical protein
LFTKIGGAVDVTTGVATNDGVLKIDQPAAGPVSPDYFGLSRVLRDSAVRDVRNTRERFTEDGCTRKVALVCIGGQRSVREIQRPP